MKKIHWDDYRIVFQVAQSGSLSKAAKLLQCNHATVLRHVNRLENALNIKLFIRHQRGYKLTDAGQILVNELPTITTEFDRLEELLGSVEQDISGNLRITTLSEFTNLLNPALLEFRQTYPKLRLQLLSTDKLIPLSSGVAHVSLRAAAAPQDPDLIAHKIMPINMGFYAAPSYVEQYGLPESTEQFNQHHWVMPSAEKHHIPYIKQAIQHIDNENIVYQSNEFIGVQTAVQAGMGIGLVAEHNISADSQLHKLAIKDLKQEQTNLLWYIFHRDLKHNAKVQALYQYLRKHLSVNYPET